MIEPFPHTDDEPWRTPWEPGSRAAVSVTFDNLGEAAEVDLGLWPPEKPLGEHESVTRALPPMLDLLAECDLRATFFVEAWNALLYPAALEAIAARGHEVASHGWRHENWAALERAEEAETLRRCIDVMRKVDIDVAGFRPPGGVLTRDSLTLLRDEGLAYCSPLGARSALVGEVAVAPFGWEAVDAYYYYDLFAELRASRGDPGEPLPPERFASAVSALVASAAVAGEHLVVVLHPFLEHEEERQHVLRGVLRAIAEADVWCATCADVASAMRANPAPFGRDPGLEQESWQPDGPPRPDADPMPSPTTH